MKGVILTYLLTYGGAAASLVNPLVGMFIYVAFFLLRPEALWYWSVPRGGRYSLVVALALLAGWIRKEFGRWEFGRARGVVICLMGFWVWTAVSASVAPDQELAWNYVLGFSKFILPCIVAMTLIESVADARRLAWVIVLAQGYVAFEFNQQYYAGTINTDEWSFSSLDNNGIAVMMVTSFGMALFLGLDERRWWAKLPAFVAAGLMAHVVLFSMSRGGMLAMAVTGLVGFLIIPKRAVHVLVFLLAIAVVLRLAGPSVQEEFSTIFVSAEERDGSAKSRLDLTRSLLQAMFQNAMTGLGPSHWALHAHEYGFEEGKAGHNTWGQVGAELGIPGVVFLLGFYILLLTRLAPLALGRSWEGDPWLPCLARAVIASLTGFLVSATFVSMEAVELPYYVGIIGAAVLKLQSMPPSYGSTTPEERRQGT